MDKNQLKKFAIESRYDLMQKMENKIKLFYIDEDFQKTQNGDIFVLSNDRHTLSLTKDEYEKRETLIKRIEEFGIKQVIEESAYTWFNRLVAIRYMELNDCIPLTKNNQSLGINVLSSKDNKPDPEILKFKNLMNPDLDINFKKEKYVELKDDNEKFKYVLLLICKKLGKVIPQVFDGITDYIDILIPDNLLNDTGFVSKFIRDVSIENFEKVEIIGWLYQYYNQTEKDKVISSKRAYKTNEIPYVTQLFTPDWIVKYMVDNTLGKYTSNNLQKKKLKYFVSNVQDINNQIDIEEITFIDPCCGSGHILVYAFEVFYNMYLEKGYNSNQIANLILENNLYGLDIDERAVQLSILSVVLKAREYDKNIFNKNIIEKLNIMAIPSSQKLNDYLYQNLTENLKEKVTYLIDTFKNGKEIGSLLVVKEQDYTDLIKYINNEITLETIEMNRIINPMIKCINILSKKYDIVVTNPPYMNNSVMSPELKKYLEKYYKDSKADLCSAFMEVKLVKDNGFLAMINQQSWMFLSSFEKLRTKLVNTYTFLSLLHLGARAFEEISGEVVQTVAFVSRKSDEKNMCYFYKLNDIDNANSKEMEFLKAIEESNDRVFKKNILDFLKIPSCVFAYEASENVINIFSNNKTLTEYASPKQGLATTDNNKFTRLWFELNINNIGFNYNKEKAEESNIKWFPLNKGGEFRKWYGNNDYVVNYQFDGKEIKQSVLNKYKYLKTPDFVVKNQNYYFKENGTWSAISNKLSVRYSPKGFIISNAGMAIYSENDLKYIIAFLNSNSVQKSLLGVINQTLNFNAGDIEKIPFILNDNIKNEVIKLTDECIRIAKEDWDSFETSWDFKTHPFIYEAGMNPKQIAKEQSNGFQVCNTLEEAYNHWVRVSKERFEKLKENEQEINKIFIDIYGLKDELSPEVDDKDITIRKADKERDVKSLISFAVGCMFGRYSLDEYGLIFAGGEFRKDNYKLFKADEDNIIPITDEAYFGDDIVERFKSFIKVAYGTNTFNENMDFIAEALGKKGTETSEDTIRRYFLNDFFNDHVKTYQKRPIYWLFDSGKKNGFKALVYLHRYNENLIPKVRLDYLHRIQTTYEKLLSDVNYRLTTDLSMTDKKAAQNRQADLNAKLNEIKEYDEKIAHIANQRISIDLDDGVKVNYEKFKDILAKIK